MLCCHRVLPDSHKPFHRRSQYTGSVHSTFTEPAGLNIKLMK